MKRIFGLEIGLLALALALRLLVVFVWIEPETQLVKDMGEYHRNALLISQWSWERVRTVQPLGFPIVAATLLALPWKWSVFKIVQCLLGTASVALASRAAALTLGERAGRLVLLLLTFHLPWIVYCGLFLTETLYTTLTCAFLYVAVRRANEHGSRAQLLVGLTLLVGLFVKGHTAFVLALWALYLLFRRVDSRDVRRREVTAFAIGVAVPAILIALAMSAAVGKPALLADAGGLNFVDGKCPAQINIDSTGMHARSPVWTQWGLASRKHWPRPFTDSLYFYREGLKCIVENPSVLLSSFEYLAYLFAFNADWPAHTTALGAANDRYEQVFGVACVLLGGLGIYSLRRRLRHRTLAPFLIAIGGLLLTSWVFKSEMRYRVPFDACFAVLIVAGVSHAWERLRARSRSLPRAAS